MVQECDVLDYALAGIRSTFIDSHFGEEMRGASKGDGDNSCFRIDNCLGRIAFVVHLYSEILDELLDFMSGGEKADGFVRFAS
jgi:hypothetical protein